VDDACAEKIDQNVGQQHSDAPGVAAAVCCSKRALLLTVLNFLTLHEDEVPVFAVLGRLATF
jgi:hypothetical protein